MKFLVERSIKKYITAANLPFVVFYAILASPFGTMLAVTISNYLAYLKFVKGEESQIGNQAIKKEVSSLFPGAENIIYSAEEVSKVIDLSKLDSLKIEEINILIEGTAFQESVWRQLIKIQRGATCFYSDLALRIGNKAAVRAVGTAVGRNPISYLIPCHRVVGKNGNVLKFGAGPEIKRRLLLSEGTIMILRSDI